MKAYIEDLELLGSRTLVIGPNQTARIVLDESEPNLHFEFVFTVDESKKGRNTEFDTKEDTKLKVTFINFEKTLGTYAVTPIRLGDFIKRELYFNYFITHLSERAGYKVEFFFYLGKELADE